MDATPFQFEGDDVTNFVAQLPAAKMASDEAYPRGTTMTLQVEVRVRSVRIDEGKGGELTRNHILAVENVQVLDTLTPARRRELIAAAEEAAIAAKEQAEREAAAAEQHTITEDPEFSPFGRDDDRKHTYTQDDMDMLSQPRGELEVSVEVTIEDDEDPDSWMDQDDDGLHVVLDEAS